MLQICPEKNGEAAHKKDELKKTFDHNGKTVRGIGGQGKLTKKDMLKIQGNFGAAIRKNPGNLENMKRDIWAIYNLRRKDHTSHQLWQLVPFKN